MSFDIFISAFQKYELCYYNRSTLEQIFGEYTENIQESPWPLSLGGFLRVHDKPLKYNSEGGPMIHSFGVNRPPANLVFWDLILKVLQQTPSVIHWPGYGTVACVANPAVIRAMPPDMVEALGYPLVVSRGEAILAAIERP